MSRLKEIENRFYKTGYEINTASPEPQQIHADLQYLIYRVKEQAERVQELEDVIHKDERQAVLESMYEENKRYREVIKKVIDDLENECLWDALVSLKALEREK